MNETQRDRDLSHARYLRRLCKENGYKWRAAKAIRVSRKIRELESKWGIAPRGRSKQKALLKRARGGDASAVSELWKRYKIKVVLP